MLKLIIALAVGMMLVAAAASGPAFAASQKNTAAQNGQSGAQATDMSAQRRYWRYRYARPWGYGFRPYYAYRRHWAPYYDYAYAYPHRYYRPGPHFGFRFRPVGFGVW